MLKFQSANSTSPNVISARKTQRKLWFWLLPLALLVAAGAFLSTLPPPEPPALAGGAAAQRQVAVSLPTPDKWRNVTDNAPFRDAETPTWFAVWQALQKLHPQETPASSGETAYAQLVAQPATYRGQVVTVRGTVLRSEAVGPAKNDLGIEQLHRVILKPIGGGEWPLIVYTLTEPAKFAEPYPVVINAVFFKALSYRHETGVGMAPVLLTNQITGPPAQVATAKRAPPLSPLAVVLLAAAGAAAFVVYAWKRSSRGAMKSHLPLLLFLALPLRVGAAPSGTELLEMLDWSTEQLATATNEELAPLAVRLKRFSNEELSALGGDFQQITGLVKAMTTHTVGEITSAELAVVSKDQQQYTVIAATAPKQWQELSPLLEALQFTGLRIERDGKVLFVTPRVTWQPTTIKLPTINFGETLLGAAGVNIAELEIPVDRQPLERIDRASFYELLAAMNSQATQDLAKRAQGRVREFAAGFAGENAPPEWRRLKPTLAEAAEAGTYSVAPLFLAPRDLRGELFTFDAVVRRAVRIEVASDRDTRGITHYYELEAYPSDSQNLPLVFCVPSIPPGFATGEDLAQPARLAGFFYKQWRYTPRKELVAKSRPFAPLLIGPAPQVLVMEKPPGSPLTPLIVGGMFAGITLLAAFLWRNYREDKQR